eukprot:PRCOL_00000194-RA
MCTTRAAAAAARAPARAALPPQPRKKTVTLVRHGQTEMNLYLQDFHERNSAAAADRELPFVDPGLRDTRLTPAGEAQAAALADVLATREPQPELIVASPLRRALLTAHLAYGALPDVRRRVEPLATERHWHASDTGSAAEELRELFPCGSWDVGHLEGREPWWPLEPETDGEFEERMRRLGLWLLARPEEHIALVCHWGVINAVTRGYDPLNCEVIHTTLTAEEGFTVVPGKGHGGRAAACGGATARA